jgi:hypothetical protein
MVRKAVFPSWRELEREFNMKWVHTRRVGIACPCWESTSIESIDREQELFGVQRRNNEIEGSS